MEWGFISLESILNVLIIPFVLAILALVWPSIQSRHRRLTFEKLILRELIEMTPYPKIPVKNQKKTSS